MHNERRKLIAALAASPLMLPAWLREAAAAGTLDQGIRGYRGQVTVNGEPARFRMPVGPGDTVRTGPGAEAVFVSGNNAFLLRGNSHMAFGSTSAATYLRVITGALLSVFGRGPKRLETPIATIGIRGTGCYIEAQRRETYFCLCYGEADLQTHSDTPETMHIASRHHDMPLVVRGGGVETPMELSSVRNHTDAELTLVEALVGRKPPFQAGSDYRY
ncbi:MAG: hypothetical protein KF778_21095 [Rhodocyclaceae bacterium]|nr:hypothetical protein [Rhodocyclaceae bacterium]MBX3670902.1 hypothetical protein [Rhodocyclaceae bacterium]